MGSISPSGQSDRSRRGAGAVYTAAASGLSLLVALLAPSTANAEVSSSGSIAPPRAARAGVVGEGVAERFESPEAGGPPIVVYMDNGSEEAQMRSMGGGVDVRALKGATRAVQERVLADLPAGSVQVRFRGSTVPVMTLEPRDSAALEALASHPDVVKVDVDSPGRGDLAQVVPLVGGDKSHTAGETGAGVTVAVLDSGIDTNHPDLTSSLVRQECFGYSGGAPGVGYCPNGTDRQSGAGSAEDDAGHGTHVNGIVASDGVVSPVGMAPSASLVAIKVMDDCSFSGCFYSFVENVVAPLDWIIANNGTWGIDVINASIGTGTTFPGDCDGSTSWTMAGADAVDTLWGMGVIFFSSAGNSSLDAMGAPACLSKVVSVGASNDFDVAAGFTNAGVSTDIFAPGVGVLSDAIGGGTTTASGTSMSSPLSAGCAALLIGSGNATTPTAVETRMKTSSVTISANGRSYPRIKCDTTATSVPPSPVPVGVTAGDGKVDVTWTPSGDGGSALTGYTVTVSPGGATKAVAAGASSTSVTGLTNGFQYEISVTANNAIGSSVPAKSRKVRPTSCDVEKAYRGASLFTDVSSSHLFCGEIEWMVASGITTGYTDGSYRPKLTVTRQTMSAFIARYVGMGGFIAPVTPSFTDVPTTHIFYKEIEWMAANGVTTGFSDGTFKPTQVISRQAMAAFLYRVAGEPPYSPPGTPSFTDVPKTHQFYKVIEWLASTGITGGYSDGTFKPTGSVSRQSVAAFLMRFDALFG